MTDTTTLRADEIVRDAIINSFASVATAADASRLAKEAHTDAQGNESRTREGAYVAFAKLAEAHAWDDRVIAKGIKLAVATRNDKSVARTMNTLASVLKNAAHPLVRANLGDMIATRDAAFEMDAEEEAQKIMKWAFSKPQFALEAMMVAVVKSEEAIANMLDADLLRDFALKTWKAKRLNPKNMAAKMKGINKLLGDFMDEFGLGDNALMVALSESMEGCDEPWFKGALAGAATGPSMVPTLVPQDDDGAEGEPNDPAPLDEGEIDDVLGLNLAA